MSETFIYKMKTSFPQKRKYVISASACLILVVDHPNLSSDLLHDGGNGESLVKAHQGTLSFASKQAIPNMLSFVRQVGRVDQCERMLGS